MFLDFEDSLILLLSYIAQNFDSGKADKFDEWMLNRRIFPTKILHLENFQYCMFYGYNSLTWFVKLPVCRNMNF